MPETKYGRPLQIEEVKASDSGDGWQVSGYAATFENVDLGGDVILPGAFKDWLDSGQKTRFLYQHNTAQVLGRPLEMREDKRGLFVRASISKTQLGQDVHTLLKDGALDSFSIGYIPQEVDFSERGDVRKLVRIDLPEFSVVAMPMNPQAEVTGVKAEDAPPAGEDLAEDSKSTWSASFINDLPDSAFAVILDGGSKDSDGKTTPRDLRKLPHHGTDGSVDLPHLRNALSREPQTDMPEAAHAKARAHLQRHASAEGIGDNGGKAVDLPLLTDLPLSEHAGIVQAELDAFVARIQDALGDLTEKGHTPTGAKRLVLEELLERCSSLDAVRSALTKTLATTATATGRTNDDPAISLNPLRRRLAATRARLLAEGILAAPTTVPAAN